MTQQEEDRICDLALLQAESELIDEFKEKLVHIKMECCS